MEMERRDKKRIGVYGGTFNPIHYGHLINAEFVREAHGLDKIIFIPSKDPVHKKSEGSATAIDRLEMVKLAIKGNSFFDVSDIEIRRAEPSFTILTFKQLKALYPDEDLFFIIGTDSFNELDTWRDSEELLSLGRFIVLNRPGNTKLREDILQRGTFHIYHNPLIEISSSDIRSKLKFGKSARYLLPDAVLEYILQKEFYKN